MTKGNEMLRALSFVGEDLVAEAEQTPKRRRPRYAMGALAAALLLAALLLPRSGVMPESGDAAPEGDGGEVIATPVELRVNWIEDSAQGALLKDINVQLQSDPIPDGETRLRWDAAASKPEALRTEEERRLLSERETWETRMTAFSAAAGQDGEQLLAALGERFSLTLLYTRSLLPLDGSDAQLHDWCIEVANADGGHAVIVLSAVGEPLRDYFILPGGDNGEDALLSHIGEAELTITGCEMADGTLYLALCEKDGVWYDVESCGFSLEELEALLLPLLASHTAS